MTRQCTQCGITVQMWEKAHMCPAVTRLPTWAPTVRVRLRRNTVRFRVWVGIQSAHIGTLVGGSVSRSYVSAHPTTWSEKDTHNRLVSYMVAYGATQEHMAHTAVQSHTNGDNPSPFLTGVYIGTQGAARSAFGAYGRALYAALALGATPEAASDIAHKVLQSRAHDHRYGPVVLSAAGPYLWGGGARVPYTGRARLQRPTGGLTREERRLVGGGPLRSPEVSGRPTLRDKVRKYARREAAIAHMERRCDNVRREPTLEQLDLQVLQGVIRNYNRAKGARKSYYRSQGRRMCRNLGLVWSEVLARSTCKTK